MCHVLIKSWFKKKQNSRFRFAEDLSTTHYGYSIFDIQSMLLSFKFFTKASVDVNETLLRQIY